MHQVKIHHVQSEIDLKNFRSFPWNVYHGDPNWVPPLLSERKSFLDSTHNPFFQNATVDFYLAKRGEEIVGTIAAFTNQRHNEFHDENIGFFGFFEVLEDPEAADALLEQAETRTRQHGHTALRGPAQFSTNDESGLLVDGFDDAPRILMTYNPKRYIDYIENRGYVKVQDLWAYAMEIDLLKGGSRFPEKLVRVVEKIKKRKDIKIRNINMRNYNSEVAIVKKIYNASWARNWGFIPFTEPEIDRLAAELKQIIDPDLVFVAEMDGEPVGFSLALPDVNEPLRKAYPHPNTMELWTMIKLIWNWRVRKEMKWLRVFALGVMPAYHGSGVDALFYYETAKAAIKKGYENAEMSWILESNDMMNRAIQLMGGEVYKTYRFYEKEM